MDGGRTTKRQYSEYSDFFSTQRESKYDQDTDLHQWEFTQVRRDGRDGRCEPDSGLGHTQDYRTGYTDDDWTFTQRTEQPAGRKRRVGGRPAVNRIYQKRRVYTETVGGIAHGSVPCLRRLVVTFRRATQIGLRRDISQTAR